MIIARLQYLDQIITPEAFTFIRDRDRDRDKGRSLVRKGKEYSMM
jgi:hypothetical protein